MEGTIEHVGQLYVLRFERRLRHPVEKVWAAITEPEQLRKWLAAAEIDPHPGGSFVLNFDNTGHQQAGRVIRYDPPRLFEHTFGDDANGVVRWELTPDGDGCLLKLSHTVYSTAEMANFLSGWHAHLELLEEALAGRPSPWNWDRWHAHKDRYAAQVASEIEPGRYTVNETTRSNNGRYSVQIERWLDHPVERVWRAITERDQLSRWYPMSVTELDLRVGGRITVDDGEGTVYRGLVQELDPPRVFSITEVDDLLHIQLEPDGDGCHLIFRHTFDDPSIMESVETGWNECLNALEEILAGRERA